MKVISLDKIKMNVIETSDNGVVNRDTLFIFSQHENMVSAQYKGGKICEGFLVGIIENDRLNFSYCQLQTDGKLDNGISFGDLSVTKEGKIRMTERFKWKSRAGETGINIFEEVG